MVVVVCTVQCRTRPPGQGGNRFENDWQAVAPDKRKSLLTESLEFNRQLTGDHVCLVIVFVFVVKVFQGQVGCLENLNTDGCH